MFIHREKFRNKLRKVIRDRAEMNYELQVVNDSITIRHWFTPYHELRYAFYYEISLGV